MITRKIIYFLLAFIPFTGVLGQEEQKLTLSIDEAQEYAIDHNKSLKAARLDVKAAEMAKWNVISNGLPRVDASGALNDNLKLMTTLLPGEIVGQPAGTYIPVQFGTKYNTNYGVQATQLIFSAPYLVGIQMASLAEKNAGQGGREE
ncbi:MAG: TolC family protein [Bacteroidales bacterium]